MHISTKNEREEDAPNRGLKVWLESRVGRSGVNRCKMKANVWKKLVLMTE